MSVVITGAECAICHRTCTLPLNEELCERCRSDPAAARARHVQFLKEVWLWRFGTLGAVVLFYLIMTWMSPWLTRVLGPRMEFDGTPVTFLFCL